MSKFDETLGRLSSLPDATSAGPSTIRAIPMLGIGECGAYLVQTIRHRETGGDWTFLEYIADGQSFRIMLPPEVTAAIARQRDALTTKNRSKAARNRATDTEPTPKQLAARELFVERARAGGGRRRKGGKS